MDIQSIQVQNTYKLVIEFLEKHRDVELTEEEYDSIIDLLKSCSEEKRTKKRKSKHETKRKRIRENESAIKTSSEALPEAAGSSDRETCVDERTAKEAEMAVETCAADKEEQQDVVMDSDNSEAHKQARKSEEKHADQEKSDLEEKKEEHADDEKRTSGDSVLDKQTLFSRYGVNKEKIDSNFNYSYAQEEKKGKTDARRASSKNKKETQKGRRGAISQRINSTKYEESKETNEAAPSDWNLTPVNEKSSRGSLVLTSLTKEEDANGLANQQPRTVETAVSADEDFVSYYETQLKEIFPEFNAF